MPKSSSKTRNTRSTTRPFPAPMARPPAVLRVGMATRLSSSTVQPPAVPRMGMMTRSSAPTLNTPISMTHQASTSLSPPSSPPVMSMLPTSQASPRRVIYTYGRHSPRRPSPQRTASVLSTESDFSLPTMQEFFEQTFPQLAPSPSYSIARYVEEIDNCLAKFTRDPRREVTPLRDALYKIISKFAEESKEANSLLERIIGIFEREAVCCICTDYMEEPVILNACGHSFCASCIHRHFCEHLALHGIVPPEDKIQLQAAIKVIEARGEVPHQFFVYSCPHCRTKVQEPPVADYQLKAILSNTKVLLHDQFKSRDMLGSMRVGPSNRFKGLFLRD